MATNVRKHNTSIFGPAHLCASTNVKSLITVKTDQAVTLHQIKVMTLYSPDNRARNESKIPAKTQQRTYKNEWTAVMNVFPEYLTFKQNL